MRHGITGSLPGAAKGPASLLMSPWWERRSQSTRGCYLDFSSFFASLAISRHVSNLCRQCSFPGYKSFGRGSELRPFGLKLIASLFLRLACIYRPIPRYCLPPYSFAQYQKQERPPRLPSSAATRELGSEMDSVSYEPFRGHNNGPRSRYRPWAMLCSTPRSYMRYACPCFARSASLL
jgi:hypothetical protein